MMKRINIFLMIICSISVFGLLHADNSYYYSENTGWHNYKNVQVGSSALSGWIWGENIGWIKLDPTGGGVKVDNQGNCTNYAYGENVGWIKFNPTGGGVTVSRSSASLKGWAWGENIGWIKFDGTGSILFGKSLKEVRIAPTTLFKDEKLIFEKDRVTDDTEIFLYDLKGREIWTSSVTGLAESRGYFSIPDNVTKALADGLYMLVFRNQKEELVIKKFNKISRSRK